MARDRPHNGYDDDRREQHMVQVDERERQLGQHVRARRLAARLTQVELADRANVSLGALKHLESGAGSTITTLVKVLRALGADDWLETLALPPAPFDPLALLEQRRREQVRTPRRVRHRADGS
jgi:transcriptional regulator with XRE-family HTH domain